MTKVVYSVHLRWQRLCIQYTSDSKGCVWSPHTEYTTFAIWDVLNTPLPSGVYSTHLYHLGCTQHTFTIWSVLNIQPLPYGVYSTYNSYHLVCIQHNLYHLGCTQHTFTIWGVLNIQPLPSGVYSTHNFTIWCVLNTNFTIWDVLNTQPLPSGVY